MIISSPLDVIINVCCCCMTCIHL